MVLLSLALALVGPYLVLTLLLGRIMPRRRVPAATAGRIGISLMFLITASGHYFQAAAMAQMLPPAVPLRLEIVYVTGVFELLGAIGVWVPSVARLTGALLIVMLIGVLPSNIYAAFARVPFGGHDAGPVYLLVRVPFQLLVIGWVYRFTGQDWLAALRRPPAVRAPGAV